MCQIRVYKQTRHYVNSPITGNHPTKTHWYTHRYGLRCNLLSDNPADYSHSFSCRSVGIRGCSLSTGPRGTSWPSGPQAGSSLPRNQRSAAGTRQGECNIPDMPKLRMMDCDSGRMVSTGRRGWKRRDAPWAQPQSSAAIC